MAGSLQELHGAPGAGPGEGGGRGHGPALQPGQGCRGRSAGGAGSADQGGIEDLAGAVLVTATGLLAHREREAAPRPARKAGTTPAGSPTGTRQQVGRKHLLH